MTINSKKKAPSRTNRAPNQKEQTKKLNELPNTFKFAAEALKTMSERGGSVGSIVVSKYKSYNYKLIYALVMNTVKNIKLIKKLIHEIKLTKKIPTNDPFLLEILVGDLLFGRGLKSIEQNSVAAAILLLKDPILAKKNELKKDYSQNFNVAQFKYLRINKLKSSLEHVVSQLKSIGLSQVEYVKDKIKFKKFLNKFKTMADNEFMVDFHFPTDLIILKPSGLEKVKKIDLIKSGKAILQDKASFMAVEALNPQKGNKIIDACFAPGGKTSLIASKLKNSGKIFAFDINKSRFNDARHLMKIQGVTCCKPEVMDFSKVKLRRLMKANNIDDFDSILLDPSCSGSGIKSRLDYKPTNEEAGRLKKLQAFQVSLLKHALKARVSKNLVYCTCSTSVQENEEALKMAIEESGVGNDWKFVDVLPFWPQRGEENYEFGSKCVRSDEDNMTNGFFIAKLERVSQTEPEPSEDEPKKLDNNPTEEVEEMIEESSGCDTSDVSSNECEMDDSD